MTGTMFDAGSRITSTPGVCAGDACICGTRVMVWLLVHFRRRGRSESELLTDFPNLTPADLDAAWAYYRQHPLEIEQAVWVNAVAVNHPHGQPVPAALLVHGRLLGLSDEQIRNSFDPPLAPAEPDAAWDF